MNDLQPDLGFLGLPGFTIHPSIGHFDFETAARRLLVIGPMGSGKTEYAARIWRDARVARTKSGQLARRTRTGSADRRNVIFVRSILDRERFPDYPADALAYRGGYERIGDSLLVISDSFDLEQAIADHPQVGTWVVDEASFYDERVAYVISRESERSGLVFVLPTLILNFRKEVFNPTARLLLECATDVLPLTAYCEHPDCLENSLYTWRYYTVDGIECPALYFDPLIIAGGDREKHDSRDPDYASRCADHHVLPGKEYAYLILKPLGIEASRGNLEPLAGELRAVHTAIDQSALWGHFREKYGDEESPAMQALRVPCIAEKMLVYLFVEQNLLSTDQVRQLATSLELDTPYLTKRCADNGRPVMLSD